MHVSAIYIIYNLSFDNTRRFIVGETIRIICSGLPWYEGFGVQKTQSNDVINKKLFLASCSQLPHSCAKHAGGETNKCWGHTQEGKLKSKKMVPEGLEPSTLTLLASRSNQLSYGTQLMYFALYLCNIS